MHSEAAMPLQSNPRADDGVDLVALTRDRIAELDRLRAMGLQVARRLSDAVDGLPPEEAVRQIIGKKGVAEAFERTLRAIRQTVVLEFELRGLFKAPDRAAPRRLRLARPVFGEFFDTAEIERERDDLRTRSDYRIGPLDEVVAGIRKALGAEPPPNDPFAPPGGPKSAQPKSPEAAPVPSVPEPAIPKPRPAKASSAEKTLAKPQKKAAMKAATLALSAMPRKGFRIPPAKPRHPGASSGPRKGRRNRGPPH
jgi:hypothetical protein